MYVQNYCKPKCEYYSLCQGDLGGCVVRLFHELFSSALTQQEKDVLCWRYGLVDGKSHPRTKIAQRYGLSAKQVKELEEHALCVLRREHQFMYWRQIEPVISSGRNTPYESLYKAIKGVDSTAFKNQKRVIPLSLLNPQIAPVPLDTPVQDCRFRVRVLYGLDRAGITCLEDVVKLDLSYFEKASRCFPAESVIEIYLVLDFLGLRCADCPKEQYPDCLSFLKEKMWVKPERLPELLTKVQKALHSVTRYYELVGKLYEALGVTTINDLSVLPQSDLINAGFNAEEIDEMMDLLHEYGYKFTWEASYVYHCAVCGKEFTDQWSFEERHFCKDCLSRK